LAPAVLTLAVTSSTAVVGVAVGRFGAPPSDVVHHEVTTDRRHAEELTPLVVRSLSEAGVSIGEVERLVVDIGPGRFTGLRVGLATVRTIAFAADVPVVGLTSLEVLAFAEPDRPVVAVVDARRAEVFQQRFDGGADGPFGPCPAEPPIVGPPEDLAAAAAGAVVVGDGADRYAELYADLAGAEHRPGRAPSAAVMIGAAAGREPLPGREVGPLYLRDPDVQINVKTRHTPR
jgi:tRNA threonylcarbamoyladenosine biosynthesis protein TsaB